jgi:hypothetical protein
MMNSLLNALYKRVIPRVYCTPNERKFFLLTYMNNVDVSQKHNNLFLVLKW